MTATAAQRAAMQTGTRPEDNRGSTGTALSRDDLVNLAVSMGWRIRNARRFIDHHLARVSDEGAVLTLLRRGDLVRSVPVDAEAEHVTRKLSGVRR